MIRFLTKRVISGLALLVVISTMAYFLVYSSGNNIALAILGEGATADQLALKEKELGLDKPILERYIDWLKHAVKGDFGSSWVNNDTVVNEITRRLPITLSLVLIAMALAAILATLIGMLAAVKGGVVDRVLQLTAVAGFAIPGFLVAILLINYFAIKWHLFPATGWVNFKDSPGNWLKSISMPIFSLVLATITSAAQQIRSAIKNVMDRDFVRTLTSRGISRREILFKHVLRASAPAGLTVLSLQFVGMLGGTVIIEQIFALPGMGSMVVNATNASDTPLIMGIVVYTVFIVIVVNLLVDLINGWLNPKVRVQ